LFHVAQMFFLRKCKSCGLRRGALMIENDKRKQDQSEHE